MAARRPAQYRGRRGRGEDSSKKRTIASAIRFYRDREEIAELQAALGNGLRRFGLNIKYIHMGGAPSRVLEEPALWLGGADALKDDTFFTSSGISAVVSVGDEAPPEHWEHIKCRLHINKRDTPDESLAEHFHEVVAFVQSARCTGRAVYIHCHAGISRSSTCCAAYLMAHLSMPLLDAMAHLLRCRDTVCPNPGFREQLAQFESSGSAAQLCTSLREAHGDALVSSDLRQVAARLLQSKGAVEAQAASEWVYSSNGRPVVDAQTLSTLTDDNDGNGPYVRVHEDGDDPTAPGRRRSVRRPAELLAEAEKDWHEGFDVPLDSLGFEAQVERLRARLQPLVDAGAAAPGGLAGLEWLAAAGGRGVALPIPSPRRTAAAAAADSVDARLDEEAEADALLAEHDALVL